MTDPSPSDRPTRTRTLVWALVVVATIATIAVVVVFAGDDEPTSAPVGTPSSTTHGGAGHSDDTGSSYWVFVDLAAGSPMIKAGKLKVLAVASARRIAALPDVPTLAEQGIANFEAWAWQGLAVPAGTPADIVARLNSEYARAVADPGVRQKLVDAGVEPVASTPEEMPSIVLSTTAPTVRMENHGSAMAKVAMQTGQDLYARAGSMVRHTCASARWIRWPPDGQTRV